MAEKTAIFLQKACLQHRYIRTNDNSHIVERPERLRAVNIGLAAALARLEDSTAAPDSSSENPAADDADELSKALDRLQLGPQSQPIRAGRAPVAIRQSEAFVDVLNHPAVKFVHGDVERDVYLETLKGWAKQSEDRIAKGESEIPLNYSQGDLYLCPGSMDAIQGALGTVCEAVDAVIDSTAAASQPGPSRAFVAVRPPGHHCGEDTPSGFCFVNNVAVAAAHAHLKHKINRVAIFDIDLHHGNGTQAIAWQINEETYRKQIESEAGAPSDGPGLQIYYGSVHDVLSFPCEDGKPDLIQAASVSIHGPHGQHIENVHLQPYASEDEFWAKLYAGPYSRLLSKASEFLESTGGPGEDVLVFISCGFDACEHEYASMSRHGRKVPTSFYYRFARDARALSDRFAKGRLVSVLEGGYSDRALTSGSMAHLAGLAEAPNVAIDEAWWSVANLTSLEAATKKRRGARPSQADPPPAWIARTLQIFAEIDASHTVPAPPRAAVPPSSRTLRERKPANGANASRGVSPATSPGKKPPAKQGKRDPKPPAAAQSAGSDESDLTDIASGTGSEAEAGQQKKLPRVILHVRAPTAG